VHKMRDGGRRTGRGEKEGSEDRDLTDKGHDEGQVALDPHLGPVQYRWVVVPVRKRRGRLMSGKQRAT